MAFELIYTSVPRGLKAGSSGFCTVACTKGLPPNVELQLEGLSAYKPYFPHYDENAVNNPVSYSHYIANAGGKKHHILSRICFYGMDYTGRSNKLAHHIVCDSYELCATPTDVFFQPGLFRSEWAPDESPQLFAEQKQIAPYARAFSKAVTWEAYTGDAGWAGFLARQYLDDPAKPVFVIFDPLQHPDILSLVAEALQLLPEDVRQQVSFNTYFNNLPAGMSCAWRFCTPDAAALKDASRNPAIKIIDLTGMLPPAGNDELQEAARSGIMPQELQAQAPEIPAGTVNIPAREQTVALTLPDSAPSGKIGIRYVDKSTSFEYTGNANVRNFSIPARAEKSNVGLWVMLGVVVAILVLGIAVLIMFAGIAGGGAMIASGKMSSQSTATAPKTTLKAKKVVPPQSQPPAPAEKPKLKIPQPPELSPAPVEVNQPPTALKPPVPKGPKPAEIRENNRNSVWANVLKIKKYNASECILKNVLDDDEAILDCEISLKGRDKSNFSDSFTKNCYKLEKTNPFDGTSSLIFYMTVKKQGNDLRLWIDKNAVDQEDSDPITANNIKYLKTSKGRKLYFNFSPRESCFPHYNATVRFTGSIPSLDKETRRYINESDVASDKFILCCCYQNKYLKYNPQFCNMMEAALNAIQKEQKDINKTHAEKNKNNAEKDKKAAPQLLDSLGSKTLDDVELKKYFDMTGFDNQYKNLSLKSAIGLYNGIRNGSVTMCLCLKNAKGGMNVVKNHIRIIK